MTRFVFLLLLLAITQSAFADATLTFKSFAGKDSQHSIIYYIKNGLLRFSEQDSKRINIYDKSRQVFLSIDQEKQTISRIDKDILSKHVEALQRQRLVALAEAEKKVSEQLKSGDINEKSLAESVINQLRYPEFYGAHTFLKTEKTTVTKNLNNIDCQIYNISRNNQLLKQVCMADYKSMGLTSGDYDTLRQFYRFDYTTQTQLLIAQGKTNFVLIDYDEENIDGLPIEITTISENENKLILLLDKTDSGTLDSSLFEVSMKNPEKLN